MAYIENMVDLTGPVSFYRPPLIHVGPYEGGRVISLSPDGLSHRYLFLLCNKIPA